MGRLSIGAASQEPHVIIMEEPLNIRLRNPPSVHYSGLWTVPLSSTEWRLRVAAPI